MTTLPGSAPHPTILTAGLGILVAFLAVGCVTPVVRASAPAYAVVYDDGETYAYDTYPRYLYNGRTVYLVGDRWYFQGDRGWAYYSMEPPGLWGYRRDYYGRYGYSQPPRYGAPPAYRGRFTAPPARPRRTGAPTYAPDARRRQPSAPYSHGPDAVPAPRARPDPGQSPMRRQDAPRRESAPQYRPAPGQQRQQQPQQQPQQKPNNNNQKKRDNGKPVRGGAA